MPPKLRISLSNFDDQDPHTRPPNTPTSRDACKAAGVLPKDLIKKEPASFQTAHTSVKHAQLAYKHHEKLRQQWLQSAMDAYHKLRYERKKSDSEPEDFKGQLEKEKMERIKNIALKEQAQIVETLVREQDHREQLQELRKKREELMRLEEEKRRKHEEKIERQRAKQKIENAKREQIVRETQQRQIQAKMRAAREKELASRKIIEEINQKKKEEWEKQKKDAQERAALVNKQRDEWQKVLDEEHKRFLVQLNEAQQKRTEMLEKTRHEVKEKNEEKAHLNEVNLQRVQKKHHKVIEEKKMRTLEKHRQHQERLDKLQAERETREKEKAELLRQREEERVERLKRTEEEARREKEEALKKHEEKQKKILKIMEQKEEELKDASFKLSLKHKERQVDRQRHLLKEEFKRKTQVEYLEGKMKKIEVMHKKREELSKVKRHATIMEQESKRRINEYLKSLKQDKVTVPKWCDEEKIENYMQKHGLDDKYMGKSNRGTRSLSPERYEELLGMRYYTRHLPEIDRDTMPSASWETSSNRSLSPTLLGVDKKRSRSVDPHMRRASATTKIMMNASLNAIA